VHLSRFTVFELGLDGNLLQYSVPSGRHLRAQIGGHAPFWVKLMGSASQVAPYMRCVWRVSSEVM